VVGSTGGFDIGDMWLSSVEAVQAMKTERSQSTACIEGLRASE